MDDAHLIGRQTPIHVRKYDGSYYRRWPVYYVMRRGPLYVAQGRAGESVHATPEPADDPNPAPITWDSDVYLYDDRYWSVIRARRDGRVQYYVNVGTPVEFDGEVSTRSTWIWTYRGLRTNNRGCSMRTNSSTTAGRCDTLPMLSSVRALPWTTCCG